MASRLIPMSVSSTRLSRTSRRDFLKLCAIAVTGFILASVSPGCGKRPASSVQEAEDFISLLFSEGHWSRKSKRDYLLAMYCNGIGKFIRLHREGKIDLHKM